MKKLIILLILTFGIFSISFSQGYNWQLIDPTSISGIPDFSDVFFTDDSTGWITSSSNANIYKTDDGAETFTTQLTSLGTSTGAIYMIDADTGFCGGGSGFVYNTVDGGNNWDFLGAMSATLTALDFVSVGQGYACGNNGTVYSISGSVTNLNSGLSTNLAGISSPSINNVWICGGSNIVYYDGSTFTFQSGPVGSYNSIFFIDDNEGWVVGTAGLIGHTEDGGDSWGSQTNPSNESLFDVFFLTTEIGWAVGATGTILSTSNGGDTWTIQGFGLTTYLLRGVHFTSPTNGYVVGNDKTLLKYTEVLGIGDEIEAMKFDIFPNPSKDRIQIECAELKNESGIIEILSLEGEKAVEKEIEKGNTNVEIDLSILEAGMYLCKISIGNRSSTQKIFKE